MFFAQAIRNLVQNKSIDIETKKILAFLIRISRDDARSSTLLNSFSTINREAIENRVQTAMSNVIRDIYV